MLQNTVRRVFLTESEEKTTLGPLGNSGFKTGAINLKYCPLAGLAAGYYDGIIYDIDGTGER